MSHTIRTDARPVYCPVVMRVVRTNKMRSTFTVVNGADVTRRLKCRRSALMNDATWTRRVCQPWLPSKHSRLAAHAFFKTTDVARRETLIHSPTCDPSRVTMASRGVPRSKHATACEWGERARRKYRSAMQLRYPCRTHSSTMTTLRAWCSSRKLRSWLRNCGTFSDRNRGCASKCPCVLSKSNI